MCIALSLATESKASYKRERKKKENEKDGKIGGSLVERRNIYY